MGMPDPGLSEAGRTFCRSFGTTCNSDLGVPVLLQHLMPASPRKQISESISVGVSAFTVVFVDAMAEACSLLPPDQAHSLSGSGFADCGVIVSRQMMQRFADLCRSHSPVFGDSPSIPATADRLHKWLLHGYWLRLVVPTALEKARGHMQDLGLIGSVPESPSMDVARHAGIGWTMAIKTTYRFFLAALDMALHPLCQHPCLLYELMKMDLTVDDIRDNVHLTLTGEVAPPIVVFTSRHDSSAGNFSDPSTDR